MSAVGRSRVATVVLVLAVLRLFLTHSLFASVPVFVIVQVLAAMLMVWSRLTFGLRSFHLSANPTEGGLVTKGPYRFLRHPIYSSILVFIWAGVASHPRLVNAVTALLASAAIAVRMGTEEQLLIERYPEYRDYAARTKRVIPFVF